MILRNALRRFVVSLFFTSALLLSGDLLYADQTCTGSASASYDPSTNTVVVTATVGQADVTPPAVCSAPGVTIAIEGWNFTRGDGCPSNSGCTLTEVFNRSTATQWGCLAPGPHTVTVSFFCNYSWSYYCYTGNTTSTTTTFTVPDLTPAAGISIEQLSPTMIRAHMQYSFANADGSRAIKLEHFLPDGTGTGSWNSGVPTATGELTKDYDISCWTPGSHRFVLTETACDRYSRGADTAYAVPDDKPSIAANVVTPGPNTARVDMPFSFPATVTDGNRALALYHTKPDGSGDGVYWIGPGNLQSGSWSQGFDTTCWPTGTHTFRATATSCNRTTETATATLEIIRKPHVAVAILKSGATKTAQITYNSPDNEPGGRSLNAEFLPVFPANTVIAIALPALSGDTGTISIDVSSFGTSGILRVQASNSCGETDVRDTYLDCDCRPNEGDKTVGSPVRLWDGSMTYSERDPLPSDGLALFARNYDTNDLRDGVFGTGWGSAFDAGLSHFTAASLETVSIQMEGERAAAFVKSGGAWTQTWPVGIGAAASLTQQSDGTWLYRDGGSSLIRIFRPDGRFGGFDDSASSRKVLIDYTSSGLPQRVYSTDGAWSCSITITGNHITTISVDTRPDLVWQYSYSGSLLQSVTLSGSSGSRRTYDYSGGRLSAVHDAAGNLIESHAYDAYGRAINSIGPGGIDITNIEYDLPGSLPDSTITRVTYATGEQTTFDQRFIDGRQQTFAVSGGCGSCGSRNSTYAVDGKTGNVVRRQDARGYITSFVYDTSGRLIQENRNDRPASCDPEQDAIHCRMTAAGLLTATLQSTSASTYLSYLYQDAVWPDKVTHIVTPSVANSSGARSDFTAYDPSTGTPVTKSVSGWIDSTTARARTTSIALYDGTLTAASGGFDPGRNFLSSWLTLPQPAGKQRYVDGPQTLTADLTRFVYYPIDNSVPATYRGRLAAVKNAAGHITTFENYDIFGNAGRVVDPNGVATETTYDALGRVLSTAVKAVPGCDTAADPFCATDLVMTRTYAPATGPLTSQTDARGNITSYEYDSRGRLAAFSRGSSMSALKERLEYTYDPATGHKNLERYLAMENGAWVEKRRESFSYDSLGQLSSQTHADNSSISYAYDDAGSIASIRDENHSSANTRYSYDPARRLATVQQTLGSTSVSTAYTYDIAGNLKTVTDPNGNVTTYGYDDFGEMVSQTSPVTGTTVYSFGNSGELLSATDANGATTTRAYDVLNRPHSAISSRSGQSDETVAWSYDSGAFGIGRLTSMTDPAGATTYSYDRRGLLLSESRTSGAVLLTTSFKYDESGNRTTVIYPGGGLAQYSFDHAGRPTTLSSSGVTYLSAATYLPFGPETSVSFANGTTQTRLYDSRYRIQRNTLSSSTSGTIADYTYTDDAAGNITSIHDMLDATYNRDFGYDDLNRLTIANSGSSLWGPGSYRYDAMGNLLARDLGGTVEVDPNDPLLHRGALTAHPDALPAPVSVHETYGYAGTTAQLKTVTSGGIDHPMTYDAAGNETRYYDARTYSPRNLMSSIAEPSEDGLAHTINYSYDGRGVRMIRSEGTTGYPTPYASRYYVYSPELQLLAVTVDDNTNVWGKKAIGNVVPATQHQIAWFNGRPVLDLVGGSTLLYTFDDHLGTPILQTDGSGSVIWRAEYDPYGDVWTMRAGAARDQVLRFPGQEYAGKWERMEERYNIFRWYRAGWGRYTQADPIGLLGGSNLYTYVKDNPVDSSDPLGLKVFRCSRYLNVGNRSIGFMINLLQTIVMPVMGTPLPGNTACTMHEFLFNDEDGSSVGTGPGGNETEETRKGALCHEIRDTSQGKCAMALLRGGAAGKYNWLGNNCHDAVQKALDACDRCRNTRPR